MTDLKSAWAIYLKAGLFLVIGVISATLLLADNFSWGRALLLGLVVWSFCRAYYFAFYVIEHYVDASFRFAGLLSFLKGKRILLRGICRLQVQMASIKIFIGAMKGRSFPGKSKKFNCAA